MESKKIVRFLFLIFAVLSVFFYVMYSGEKKSKSYLSNEFVDEAVMNLNLHGIDIDGDKIVRNIPDDNIYVFEYADESEYTDAVIKAFEKCLDGAVTSNILQTPDGLSVTFTDKNMPDVKIGRLLFSNDDLKFTFILEGYDGFAETDAVCNGKTDVDGDKKKTVDRFVQSMTSGKDTGNRIAGCEKNDGYTVISVAQTVDGKDVKDVFVNFYFDDTKLAGVYGIWITEKPKAQYHEKLIDGINVLYKLDLDKVSQVVSEKNVYSLRKSDGYRFFLVPCWEIVYVDNDGNVLKEYFDALQ